MERLTSKNPYWIGEEFWLNAEEPDEEKVDAVYLRLKAYEETGLEPEEVAALVKARDEGRVVVLEDITAHQANTVMGMCERLNAMKARHGDDQEPLVTWQLYNALVKSFACAEAEAALGGGGDG